MVPFLVTQTPYGRGGLIGKLTRRRRGIDVTSTNPTGSLGTQELLIFPCQEGALSNCSSVCLRAPLNSPASSKSVTYLPWRGGQRGWKPIIFNEPGRVPPGTNLLSAHKGPFLLRPPEAFPSVLHLNGPKMALDLLHLTV